MRSHYTHVCYVKGWKNKAQPLTPPPWNQVAIRVTFARRRTGVGLGACCTGDTQGHHGHGGKNECVSGAMGVRKSKVETF